MRHPAQPNQGHRLLTAPDRPPDIWTDLPPALERSSALELRSRPQDLALISWMHGGPLPPPQPRRLLEIGCGDGANLLALAFYDPGGTYLGVDDSAVAIARAQEDAERLGLTNLTFCRAPWRDEPLALDGPFDVIQAHQALGWLDDPQRGHLFSALRSLLAPLGLATVGYHAEPAWTAREQVRELLRRSARGLEDPVARAERAMELAQLLWQAIPAETSHPHAANLGGELEQVVRRGLGYLHAEYLSGASRGDYLTEIVELARAHQLAYVADTHFNLEEGRAGAVVEATLREGGLEGFALQEALDAVAGRQERTALLCHATAPRPPPAGPEVLPGLMAMSVIGALLPTSERSLDFPTALGRPGDELTVSSPLAKAALFIMAERAPAAIKIAELATEAERWVRGEEIAVNAASRTGLLRVLMQLYWRGEVALALSAAPARELTWIPHPLARLEAERGRQLSTAHHTTLEADAVTRELVRRLDRKRDNDELLAELVELAATAEIDVRQSGRPLRDREELEPLLRGLIAERLALLSKWGLLSG